MGHLTLENPDIISALEMFWNDKNGIEVFASPLMLVCIEIGLLGSANLILEYLEEENRVLGILPCERADLIMAADSFNQGVNPKLVIGMLERIDALIAWDHEI